MEAQGSLPELKTLSFDEEGRFHVALASTEGVYFRIISGDTPQKLAQLHGDPNRKLVFVGDGERLRELDGKTPWEMLMDIGHHPDYVRQDLARGIRYKIVIFKESREGVELATWQNILKIVAETYASVAHVFDNQRLVDGLMQCDIASIEWMANLGERGFSEIHQAGKNDPEVEPAFMTYERYFAKIAELSTAKNLLAAQAGAEIAEGVYATQLLVYTRLFLYNTLALFRLFTGKGFSIEELGHNRIETGPEYVYFMMNRALSALENYSALQFSVVAP